jgi:pSer/pThr/pTyr-binding forkhead associated (FHA) protein
LWAKGVQVTGTNDTLHGNPGELAAFAATTAPDISVLQRLIPDRPHLLQVIAGGDGKTESIRLSDQPLVIGRSEHVDVGINAGSLSRRHARLERGRNGFTVTDLMSSNGVYVNEVRVHSAILRDGDMVQFGNVVMRYFRGY